jgi:hypothetical protein
MTVNFVDEPYLFNIGKSTAAITKSKIKIVGSIMFYKTVLADYQFFMRAERFERSFDEDKNYAS